ncbi:MAG: phage portal protein [Chitinophagaceae bacterium]
MDDLQIINFAKHNIPQPTESRNTTDDKWVTWGSNNLYPEYLLRLYNSSPVHAGIIDNKTTHIIGDGLVSKDGKPFQFVPNAIETSESFLRKIVTDYVLFGAFAVEVRKNMLGQVVDYIPVPLHKLRMNKSKVKFWFLDDWSYMNSRKHVVFEEWSDADNDSVSKIFYFQSYRPGLNSVYSIPEYVQGLVSIETDISIKNFTINNVKNGFSASSVLSFFGDFSEDQKKRIHSSIKEKFTGEDGDKIIVDFRRNSGDAPNVQQLGNSNFSEPFEALSKSVENSIHFAHSFNPLFSGVKTEGSLGNSAELEIAYTMFSNSYLNVKRNELESALNYLFSTNPAISSQVSFKPKPLFEKQLDSATKEKIMTIDELRAEAGLQPLPNGEGQRLLASNNQVLSISALQPAVEEKKDEVVKKKLTEQDYEKIAHMGISAEEFDIVEELDANKKLQFDLQSDIGQYVIDNDIKELTLPQLKKLLEEEGINSTVSQIKKVLKDLHDSGIVDVSYDNEGKVKVLPQPKPDVPDTDKIEVMYKYILRPGVEGPILKNSRDFCVRVVENNRMYTRAEIQQMSGIFGYDIYAYCGGFYFNPKEQKLTPYCRHAWKAYSVKRKKTANK